VLSAAGFSPDAPLAPARFGLVAVAASAAWPCCALVRCRELRSTQARLLEAGTTEEHAADAAEEAWLTGEVVAMISEGWSREQLADVGFGAELLRDLGLDAHPALDRP
jgi:hypothetical protein